MIKNPQILADFEKQLLKTKKTDIMQNIKIFDSLYREALNLGIIPLKNSLEGLEIDIKIAKVINNGPKFTKKNSTET